VKPIAAVIQPFRPDGASVAVSRLGVRGPMVAEVRGFGRPAGEAGIARNTF